jgi:hypothetical protein
MATQKGYEKYYEEIKGREDISDNKNIFELLMAKVDCGERTPITTNYENSFVYEKNVIAGDMVTIHEDSEIDNPIFELGDMNEKPFGIALLNGVVMGGFYQQYKLIPILLLGKLFRIKQSPNCLNSLQAGQRVFLDAYGITDNEENQINEARDLNFNMIHKKELNADNPYCVVLQNFINFNLTTDSKVCLDLTDLKYKLDDNGNLTIEYDEDSIIDQIEFETLPNGDIIAKIPDMAILNTIEYKTLLENEMGDIFQTWSGCD